MEANTHSTPVTHDARAKQKQGNQPKWRSERGSESPLVEAKHHFTPVTSDARKSKNSQHGGLEGPESTLGEATNHFTSSKIVHTCGLTSEGWVECVVEVLANNGTTIVSVSSLL